MRALFVTACFTLSVFAAYFGHPLVRDNSDAVTVMITFITVFAGFLVAIIAILGDPAAMPRGNWRIAEARRPDLDASIIRHTYLFYCYLLAIGFLFVGVLIKREPASGMPSWLRLLIESTYLFFAVFSFLLTLAPPSSLGRIQMARSEAEIEARRQTDGIRSLKDP